MNKSIRNILNIIISIICAIGLLYIIVCWVDVFTHNLPGMTHNYLPFNFFCYF